MDHKGRKKSQEPLAHRIAAILYSVLLVLSLVPTQGLAEARDEVIDLIDDAAVELSAQSEDMGIQTLESDDNADVSVIANDDGDDEDVVAIANEEGDDEETVIGADVDTAEQEDLVVAQEERGAENPAINLDMTNPSFDVNNRTEEIKWELTFMAPTTGYPAPTTLSIDYPMTYQDAKAYYDVLSDNNAVTIMQTMPEGDMDYEVVPIEAPENPQTSDKTEEIVDDMYGEVYYNELNGKDNLVPVKDNYAVQRRYDENNNEVGFDIIFVDGIRGSETDRLFEVNFWTLLNQDWISNENASTEHECDVLLDAGKLGSSNYVGYMTANAYVNVPHVHCDHPNPPVYKSLGAKQHRWLCKDCGLYRYEDHNPEKIVITPATETDPEVAQWQCKECGQTFVNVDYKEYNGGPVVKTEQLASGTEIIMPECDYNPPQPGQTFDKWDVQTGNEVKQLVYPGESATLLYNTTITARWLDAITYIDENGEEKPVPAYEMIDERSTNLAGGWYVVQGAQDLSTKTTYIDNGVVNLVLCDGAEFKTNGIVVKGSGVLNIYGQSEGNGTITSVSSFGIRNFNKVSMYSGVITGAEEVGIYNSGTLNLAGGKITGNGKGIDQSDPNTAQLNVWGSPQVYGNNKEVEVTPGVTTAIKNNITLPEGMYINVVGKLNDDAELWVLTEASGTGTITNGYRKNGADYGNPADPTAIFVSDHNNMAVSKTLTETGEVQTEKAVAYINANGERAFAADCTTITSSTTKLTSEGTENNEAWYALEYSVTINERLQVEGNGTVNIILCDGAILNCPKGVRTVTEGGTIKIWGQDDGSGVLDAGYANYMYEKDGTKKKELTDRLLELIKWRTDLETAKNAGDISDVEYQRQIAVLNQETDAVNHELSALTLKVMDNAAAIGADANNITNFELYGGKVYAKGGTNGAGIGGGSGGGDGNSGSVTIFGGEVIAVAGTNGAGIGGGYANHCPKIYIKGGKVTATGGDGHGAGIGGGHGGSNDVIEITGGEIIADGGAAGGAAIGSGDMASQSGKIAIGGTAVVDAKATVHGAGIGTGDDINSNHNINAGEIEIYGNAIVTAEGNRSGAGIGGGDDSQYGGKITIKDNAVVTAIGGEDGGAGIGGGKANDYGNGKGADVIIGSGTTVEAWSQGRGAAIGAAKGSTDHGELSIPDTYMVTYADEQNAGKRSSLGDERVDKAREGYAKIEACDHKGVTGQDQTRFTNHGATHIKTCMLCKTDLGIEEEHTGVPCEKCGFGEDEYSYIDENGVQHSLQREQVTAISVSDGLIFDGTSEDDGKWYCADSTKTVSQRAEVTGKVNLILRDGCTITFSKGIHLTGNAELNIYGQTGESGTLKVPESGVDDYYAGIGGNKKEVFGTLNVRGGRMYVFGGQFAAGIGTGGMESASASAAGGVVNIYRGTIEATGGVRGAGIGGGTYGRCEEININGGTVTAKSGKRGNTNANGAGLGGGAYASAGSITIKGGDVKAESIEYGAGIGAGGGASKTSSNGTVSIEGGLVDAKCDDHGAGIGGGYDSNGCEVTITGGTVNARGNMGAGIGGGENGAGQKVTISGGTVDAATQSGGAGIGSGPSKDFNSEINITGGTVNAAVSKYNASVGYGAGIGAGYNGKFTGKILISGSKTNVTAVGGLNSASIGGAVKANDAFNGNLTVADNAVVEMWNISTQHGVDGQLAVGYFAPFVATGKPNEYQDYLTNLNSHINLYKFAKVVTDNDVTAERDKRTEVLATKQYAKIMPCKHAAKEWVSTDDFDHWQRCVYCMAEKEEDGIGTVVPHEFIFSSARTCTCGKQGREINFESGYGSGVMAREIRSLGSNFIVPTCAFVAPTDGSNKATFAGWRVNNVYDVDEAAIAAAKGNLADYQAGMTEDQITNAKNLENKIVQPGEVIYIPARQLNTKDSKDAYGVITLTATWEDPRGVPYTNLDGGTSYASNTTKMSIVTDVLSVSLGEDGKTTWYYVDKNVTYAHRVSIKGNVNIILGDAQTAAFDLGIRVPASTNAKLTIWGQQEQTGTLNAKSADSNADTNIYNAPIGGDTNQKAGEITINGGIINATGGKSTRDFFGAAGIGGGANAGITSITINAGTVTATGMTRDGAGIGNGGNSADSQVYNTTGTITINGGNVTATGGEDAAGIGGGGITSTVKSITINGGVVKAKGGASGPGIGTGREGSGAYDITIGGNADVTATGGKDGAGIGSGKYCQSTGTVTIGGTAKVTVTGGAGSDTNGGGAGIGGGLNGPAASVEIKDSATVIASNGTPYSTDGDPAGRYPIGSGYGLNSAGRIDIYSDASVSTKYKTNKVIKDKPTDVVATKYAMNSDRVNWCTQKNNVTIAPCAHKYQEITYYDSTQGKDILVKPYQASYTPTEDQSKHVIDCMFCNSKEDTPTQHLFNNKGVCGKCGATSHQVAFDANGGTGTFKAVNVALGDEYTLPSCPFKGSEGMCFAGWTIGTNEYASESELLPVGRKITISESITLYAQWKAQPTLEVWSSTWDLKTPNIAHVEVAQGAKEYYEENKDVTIIAPGLPAYDFIGWFEVLATDTDDKGNTVVTECGVDPVSQSMHYTFPIVEDTKLVAIYDQKQPVTITVNSSNDALFTVTGISTPQNYVVQTVDIGSVFTIEAKDKTKVKEFLNSNHNVINAVTNGTYSFTVTRSETITVVYNHDEMSDLNASFVCFKSSYGQVIGSSNPTVHDTITYPSVIPSKMGYKFIDWVFADEEGEATDESAGTSSADSQKIYDKIAQGVPTIILVPRYEYVGNPKTGKTKTLVHYVTQTRAALTTTEQNSIFNLEDEVGLKYGDSFSISTSLQKKVKNDLKPEYKGYVFDHIEDRMGNVLGYGKLTAVITSSTQYYVVFTDSKNGTPEDKKENIIKQFEPVPEETEGVYKVKAMMSVSLKNGWTVVDAGFVWAFNNKDDEEMQKSTIILDSPDVQDPYVFVPSSGKTSASVRCNIAVGKDQNRKVTARAFAHIQNTETGEVEVIYSEIISTTYRQLIS